MKALLAIAPVLAALVVATPGALGAGGLNTGPASASIQDYSTTGPAKAGEAGSLNLPSGQPQGFITDTLAPGGGYSSPYDTQQQGAFITDTLAPGGGYSSPYDTQQQGAFITDTLAPGGGVAAQSASATTGFSWPDAGVGAAAGFGGMLALIGIVLLTVRRRAGLSI
jgi:hypothetical protein